MTLAPSTDSPDPLGAESAMKTHTDEAQDEDNRSIASSQEDLEPSSPFFHPSEPADPPQLMFEAPESLSSNRNTDNQDREDYESSDSPDASVWLSKEPPHVSSAAIDRKGKAPLGTVPLMNLPFATLQSSHTAMSPSERKSLKDPMLQTLPPQQQPTRTASSSSLSRPPKSLSLRVQDKEIEDQNTESSRHNPSSEPSEMFLQTHSIRLSLNAQISGASYDPQQPSLPFSHSKYPPSAHASGYQPPVLDDEEDQESQEMNGIPPRSIHISGPNNYEAHRDEEDQDYSDNESEDEVPASLQFELQEPKGASPRQKFPSGFSQEPTPNFLESGLLSAAGSLLPNRWTSRWGTASKSHHRYAPLQSHHPRSHTRSSSSSSPFSARTRFLTLDSGLDHIQGGVGKGSSRLPRIRTWRDVKDYDLFLTSLYSYYTGKGFFCILHSQITKLLIILFMMGFSTFVTSCIDYSLVHSKKLLSQVLYPDCYSR